MANYTFTSYSCYALSTHQVSFTSSVLTIKLTSTGATVYSKSFSAGQAFMCQGNDFCIGTLSDNGTFVKTVDFNQPNARLWLVEKNNANQFIGSDNDADPGVSKNYDLNQCPIFIKDGGSNTVLIKCPCENSSGPCCHSCYTSG